MLIHELAKWCPLLAVCVDGTPRLISVYSSETVEQIVPSQLNSNCESWFLLISDTTMKLA